MGSTFITAYIIAEVTGGAGVPWQDGIFPNVKLPNLLYPNPAYVYYQKSSSGWLESFTVVMIKDGKRYIFYYNNKDNAKKIWAGHNYLTKMQHICFMLLLKFKIPIRIYFEASDEALPNLPNFYPVLQIPSLGTVSGSTSFSMPPIFPPIPSSPPIFPPPLVIPPVVAVGSSLGANPFSGDINDPQSGFSYGD
jgi:hypothetical protein